MRRKYACEKWKRRRMCASARKDDMMEECMNGNKVCARWRLVSMCVFPKAVRGNVHISESVVQDARQDRTSASTTGERRPPRDYGGRCNVWSGGWEDVLRMHRTGIGSVHSVQKKQRRENRNQNQNRLTRKGQRRQRMRQDADQTSTARKVDNEGKTRQDAPGMDDRKDTIETY